MAAIRRRAARGFPAGERLPSIRRLAAELRFSPSTVADAYDRLVAEGFVQARPGAGFYLWCRLPDGVDSAELSRLALAESVVLAPGNVFSVAQNAAGFMRFNVAQMQDWRIDDVLDRMLRELHK